MSDKAHESRQDDGRLGSMLLKNSVFGTFVFSAGFDFELGLYVSAEAFRVSRAAF